ncbi:hypothetical protein GCK72_001504 [Caenorhabditis remanei]|uniref:Uncharacterized protein n=1 Tax=Caenorhabditis remanei TaxID=31234 RepID=A0A6A5HTM7_CAERE|nr:hypothetical protein GCK72_001504 [Caenorhabditis remanei]KAF1769687.1 hypothetical protein GCK72_001504 [Caenorhabditis remanei]
MAPPTRRSQTRQTPQPVTSSPVLEKKLSKNELLIGGAETSEADIDTNQKHFFSFQEEGLTVEECAQKFDSFVTKEDFFATIAPEEVSRFMTKAVAGKNGGLVRCMVCSREYATGSGILFHLKKCSLTEVEVDEDVEKYRNSPILWLKVSQKEETLEKIVGKNYSCFSHGCSKSFKTAKSLINHLDACVRAGYWTFSDRPDEFRKLDKKPKNLYVKEALAAGNGKVACFLCGRIYSHTHGLLYHIDRCQVEEADQPWKCYRCGFEAKRPDAEAHLLECGRQTETKLIDSKMEAAVLSFLNNTDDPDAATPSTKRRRTVGGAPRVTARKDGSTLFRFRKSTVNRSFNGIVTRADQQCYEETCRTIFENWKLESDTVAFSNRLQNIPSAEWTPEFLDESSQFYRIFQNRQSVTICTGKSEGLQSTIPPGIRLNTRESVYLEKGESESDLNTTVAYCGAPINGIQVAPGKTSEGDDVICVTTFANETNFESDSSVVQFWKHRLITEDDSIDQKSQMELWFLLHIPHHGTILSMTWLQKYDSTEAGLIGFVAFATSIGRVLIYRIDETILKAESSSSSESVSVITNVEPHLILTLPKSPESSSQTSEDDFLNATVKIEGEEMIIPIKFDESIVPIVKISWSGHSGGGNLAGITGLGAIAIWNLDGELNEPRIHLDESWQSPPTDISFLNYDHLVVGFKERLVKVVNIDSWDVKLEENTMKTAGARVHTDSRIVHSFFTFQSEYTSFPYTQATGVSYVNMDLDSMNLFLIPTGNTHQLMTWEVAMCAPLGTLLSCGVDGRLLASASGRLLKNNHLPFFANRNLIALKRCRVLKEEDLIVPKMEESETSASKSSEKQKEPLEESLVNHDEVCQKMWLEVAFDEPFEPKRVELSCRDQRIESLNCVDATTNSEFPVAFTGGEAGLLFAVPSKLVVKNMNL